LILVLIYQYNIYIFSLIFNYISIKSKKYNEQSNFINVITSVYYVILFILSDLQLYSSLYLLFCPIYHLLYVVRLSRHVAIKVLIYFTLNIDIETNSCRRYAFLKNVPPKTGFLTSRPLSNLRPFWSRIPTHPSFVHERPDCIAYKYMQNAKSTNCRFCI